MVGTDWECFQAPVRPDGRAKIVPFPAHWCLHCQVEVPEVQDWLDFQNLSGEWQGVGFPDEVASDTGALDRALGTLIDALRGVDINSEVCL